MYPYHQANIDLSFSNEIWRLLISGENMENASLYNHPIWWSWNIVGCKRESSSTLISILRYLYAWYSLELEILIHRKRAWTCKYSIQSICFRNVTLILFHLTNVLLNTLIAGWSKRRKGCSRWKWWARFLWRRNWRLNALRKIRASHRKETYVIRICSEIICYENLKF